MPGDRRRHRRPGGRLPAGDRRLGADARAARARPAQPRARRRHAGALPPPEPRVRPACSARSARPAPCAAPPLSARGQRAAPILRRRAVDARRSRARYGCPDRTCDRPNGELERARNGDDESDTATASLQELARRHLWLHFSRMGAYDRGARDPDHRPRRGLLRLGRARQSLPRRRSARCSARTSATAAPTSRRPAPTRRASSASSPTGPTRTRARSSSPPRSPSLAPGDLNRVFFTSGGGEAVESALKVARQFHKLTGNPNKTKVIAREVAYHGTTLGALSATGVTEPARAVRAVHARRLPRAEHEPLPARARLRRREPGRGDRARGSSSRGPRRSPP